MDSISSSLKAPKTKHPILPEIAARWSPRSFSERMITLEELETMIEAATWAPSSTNDQPWRYVAAFRGSQLFQDYFDCLMPGNRFWADKASVILVSLAVKDFAANGAFNRHAMYDVGAANTLLLVQGAAWASMATKWAGLTWRNPSNNSVCPPTWKLLVLSPWASSIRPTNSKSLSAPGNSRHVAASHWSTSF